jgi:hypothetical protein
MTFFDPVGLDTYSTVGIILSKEFIAVIVNVNRTKINAFNVILASFDVSKRLEIICLIKVHVPFLRKVSSLASLAAKYTWPLSPPRHVQSICTYLHMCFAPLKH